MKFRRKALPVEVFQMTPQARVDNTDWPQWMHEAWNEPRCTPGSVYPKRYPNSNGADPLCVGTPAGPLNVYWGDWIVREPDGNLTVCNPRILLELLFEEDAPDGEGLE